MRSTVLAYKSAWVVLLVAFLFRTIWAAAIDIEQTSDARGYQLLAHQLACGNVYGFDGTPYTYWPVGYPFFLSLQYRLFGEHSWMITAISVVLGTATVALTMILTQQWFSDLRVATVAGAILALYPVHIQFITITASESLFTVLLLTAIVFWGNRAQHSIGRAILTGLLLGLAAYVRPLALGVVGVLAIVRWFSGSRLRSICTDAGIAAMVVVFVVAPWTLRNYRIYGCFVPISTNGGMCLFFGNNPLTPEKYQSITHPPDFVGNDVERDAYCTSEAIKYIKTDPWAFVKRTLRKILIMWERDTIGVVWNVAGDTPSFGPCGVFTLKLISQLYWLLFLVFCIAGTLALLIQGRSRTLLRYPGIWVSLAFTIVYGVTFSQDRYHYPLVPLIAPLAAIQLAKMKMFRRT